MNVYHLKHAEVRAEDLRVVVWPNLKLSNWRQWLLSPEHTDTAGGRRHVGFELGSG